MAEERDVVMFKRARGKDGKEYHGVGDIIDAHYHWKESTPGTEVQGDGNANGTSICTLSVAAGKRFLCTVIMASSNLSAMLRLGAGALGAITDIHPIDLQGGGGLIGVSPKMPFFEVDNSGGATALTLRMYAPQTAKGSASNNSTSHYFDGFIGGLEY